MAAEGVVLDEGAGSLGRTGDHQAVVALCVGALGSVTATFGSLKSVMMTSSHGIFTS